MKNKTMFFLAYLFAACVGVCISSSAIAQTSVASRYAGEWSGFYVGGNGGWGFQQTSNADFGADVGKTDGHSGGLLGGTLGYGWQNGMLVVGIEGDYAWANIVTQGFADAGGTTCFFPCRSELTSLGTLRGRLGFLASNSLLIYATGGRAWGEFHNSESSDGSGNGSRNGWAFGGGVEGKIDQSWSWKLEYLHVDFDNKAISYNSFNTIFQTKFDTNIVRFGLNFKFGG